MNDTIREFCKWLFKYRPDVVNDLRRYVAMYSYEDMQEGNKKDLIRIYVTPLLRRFARDVKGYDTHRREWRVVLFPEESINYLVNVIYREYLK